MAKWWETAGAEIPVIGGFFESGIQRDAARAATGAQVGAEQQAMDELRGAYGDIEGMYADERNLGGQALRNLASGVLGGQFVAQPNQFSYGRDVSSFMDPSAQYQQDQMRSQLEQSAVARGGLLSGATAKGLQENASNLAMRDWANAYNRMMQDRNFAYDQYTQDFNMRRQSLADRYNQLSDLQGIGSQATSNVAQARGVLGNALAQGQQNIGAYQAGGAIGQAATYGGGRRGLLSEGSQLLGMFGGAEGGMG